MIRPALLLASLLALPLAASAANRSSAFTVGSDGWTTAAPAGEGVQTWLTSVTINGELHAGPGEVVGFDNIQVTAVPETASLAMLLGGVALLAARRRWR